MTSDNAREELARLIHPHAWSAGFGGGLRNALRADRERSLADADRIRAAGYEKRTPAGEIAGVAEALREQAQGRRNQWEAAYRRPLTCDPHRGSALEYGRAQGFDMAADFIEARASRAPDADASGVEG